MVVLDGGKLDSMEGSCMKPYGFYDKRAEIRKRQQLH